MLEDDSAPQPEIDNIFDIGGFSFTGTGLEQDLDVRAAQAVGRAPGNDHTLDAVLARLGYRLYLNSKMGIQGAFARQSAAVVPGLGFQGGFDFELEDRGTSGLAGAARSREVESSVRHTRRTAGLTFVYTTFTQQLADAAVDVDRNKAQSLGVNARRSLQHDAGLPRLGVRQRLRHERQSYRVYVQADQPYRSRVDDLQNIYVQREPDVVNGVSRCRRRRFRSAVSST